MAVVAGAKVVDSGLILNLDPANEKAVQTGNLEIEYLMVGGGGGGGGYTGNGTGGGGGGGGFAIGKLALSASSHSVVVGSGGTGGGTSYVDGTNGGNSSIAGFVALGGGGGGASSDGSGGRNGLAGGSGGGGGGGDLTPNGTGGSALQPSSLLGGYGNDGGGSLSASGDCSGGGGGAGSPGDDFLGSTVTYVVAGGAGKSSRITGSTVYYAGGGGGAARNTGDLGPGGIGGGGAGSSNGAINTGGGGGGSEPGNPPGNGGSGIVIVRYKGAQQASGGDSIYQSGPYTVHVFNNSGNFVIGGAVGDVSGNNNGGAINGATYNAGVSGYYSFDGTDDSIIIPSKPEFLFNTGDSITVESWINPSNIQAQTYQAFFTIGGVVGVDRDRMIQMRVSQYTQYGYIDMLHRNSTNTAWQILRTATTHITNNNWYHVVGTLTYGTGSSWKIYINGESVSTTYHSGNGNVSPIQPSDVSVYVGIGEDGNTVTEMFLGLIGLSKLYNRALTAAEVTQNFEAMRGRFGV